MLTGIGEFIAWIAGIVVLWKLFKKEGLIKAIVGFICMLYTYIWGWQHIKDESLGLKTWMYVWTGAVVIGAALAIFGTMQAASGG